MWFAEGAAAKLSDSSSLAKALEAHVNHNGKAIGGVVPIIPVPFDAGESVDEGALRRLVDFAVACKLDAICLPAYGSEFYKLSEEERTRVVALAANQAAGRLQVVAQCNHGSSKVACALARSNLAAGADLLSIAIPRQFPVPDEDLLRFLAAFLNSSPAPCLIQDFNPGGPTLSAAFLTRLRSECPNLCYLKLEEPLSASKVAAMVEATAGEVGVLTGWGGLYMLELIPAGNLWFDAGFGPGRSSEPDFLAGQGGGHRPGVSLFRENNSAAVLFSATPGTLPLLRKALAPGQGVAGGRPLPGGRLPAGRLYPGAFRAPPAAGAANVGGGRPWEKSPGTRRVKSEEWRVESGQPRVSGTSKHLMN